MFLVLHHLSLFLAKFACLVMHECLLRMKVIQVMQRSLLSHCCSFPTEIYANCRDELSSDSKSLSAHAERADKGPATSILMVEVSKETVWFHNN